MSEFLKAFPLKWIILVLLKYNSRIHLKFYRKKTKHKTNCVLSVPLFINCLSKELYHRSLFCFVERTVPPVITILLKKKKKKKKKEREKISVQSGISSQSGGLPEQTNFLARSFSLHCRERICNMCCSWIKAWS